MKTDHSQITLPHHRSTTFFVQCAIFLTAETAGVVGLSHVIIYNNRFHRLWAKLVLFVSGWGVRVLFNKLNDYAWGIGKPLLATKNDRRAFRNLSSLILWVTFFTILKQQHNKTKIYNQEALPQTFIISIRFNQYSPIIAYFKCNLTLSNYLWSYNFLNITHAFNQWFKL